MVKNIITCTCTFLELSSFSDARNYRLERQRKISLFSTPFLFSHFSLSLARFTSTKKDGETAFHIAARYGHITTLRLLLTDGADYHMLNKLGENVLHIVCKECHFEIAQRLIQHVIATSSKEAATKLVNQPNKVSDI